MPDHPSRPSPRSGYRLGYLQFKSVLHDRVTGLPTLPMLLDPLRSMLESHRQVGVIYVDLGDVAWVESLYGWQVFDDLMRRVAETVQGARGTDLPDGALVALTHLAGGGIVVALARTVEGDEVQGGALARAARALRRRLEASLATDPCADFGRGQGFRVGHALLSLNPFYRFERSVWAAVEEARGGPDRRERRRDLSWGEQLRGIIRDGNIDTLFQSVIELKSGTVLGHEALVRGPRDTLFEAPRALFAVSARLGLADELDRLCCESAVSAAVRLPERGQVFLNVLPATVGEGAWREGRLPALLATHGIEPGDVVLEFSERELGEDALLLLPLLAQVRAAGFRLALDDLGTGRSTRELLERARPDYLKLDGALVHGVDHSEVQLEILEGVVTLSRRIGAEVIAEGIEREVELQVLRGTGARYGQGYLFGVPASAGTFVRADASARGH